MKKETPTQENGAFGRDEMNLAEFPAWLLTKAQGKVKTLEFSDVIKGAGGKPIQRKWVVTGSDKYGLPVRDDEAVYVALMQIAYEQGFTDRKVNMTKYKLLKAVGWPTHSGAYAKKALDSLNRLLSVTITTTAAFWDNETKQHTSPGGFHIISNFKFGPDGYFRWDEVIWQSIQKGYIKRLDTAFWFSLKNHVARRLYRFLDKRLYKSPAFSMNLKRLSFEHLGLSRNYDSGQIKRILKPALQELVDRRFLREFRYEKGPEGEILFVVRTPGTENQEELPFQQATVVPSHQQTSTTEVSPVVAQLIKRGITRQVAITLAQQRPPAYIEAKIELFDYLREKNAASVDQNPAGYLRKAIEDDYAPPDGFMTKAERDAQAARYKAAEQARQRAQERQQKLDEFRSWMNMTPEKRAEGELWVWKMRFKRDKKRSPSADEVEAVRQELLERQETPAQKWAELFPGEKYPGTQEDAPVVN